MYLCHSAFQGSVLADKNTISSTKLVSLPPGIVVDSTGMSVGGHAIITAACRMASLQCVSGGTVGSHWNAPGYTMQLHLLYA